MSTKPAAAQVRGLASKHSAARSLSKLSDLIGASGRFPSAEDQKEMLRHLAEATAEVDVLRPSQLSFVLDPLFKVEWYERARQSRLVQLADLADHALRQIDPRYLTALGARVLYNISVIKYHAQSPRAGGAGFSRSRQAVPHLDRDLLGQYLLQTPDEFSWLILHYEMTAGDGLDVEAEFLDRNKRLSRLNGRYECDGLRCHACYLIHSGRCDAALETLNILSSTLDRELGRSPLSKATMRFYLNLMRAETHFRRQPRDTSEVVRLDALKSLRQAFDSYDLNKKLSKDHQTTSESFIANITLSTLYQLEFFFDTERSPRKRPESLFAAKHYQASSDQGGCFRSRRLLDQFITEAEASDPDSDVS